MRKKRVMIVGPSKSGKTTLANILNDDKTLAKHSEDVIYGRLTIDVPSAYLENTWMYKHLIALSQDASHILILVDSNKKNDIYPPAFAEAFNCPVVGVVTKKDLDVENKSVWDNIFNEMNISKPYFEISSVTGKNIEALKAYIEKNI